MIVFRRDDDEGISLGEPLGEGRNSRMLLIVQDGQAEFERIDNVDVDQRIVRQLAGDPIDHAVT